ncbi:family 43 glycosylhydrolase [Actinomadura opuntiae]|uniref:family 43 glycosylhydrolase n=1 Tax=Actinomadura sp. OS1-43 TaxID=604315 RepID=UPI00255A8A0D|nr:family 43 glycosylhydrolase [Actinomadura sp. OS1-43]MDL4818484.1 family 43 glycosylhydrolase [Actinomadura sp. OS1-43]
MVRHHRRPSWLWRCLLAVVAAASLVAVAAPPQSAAAAPANTFRNPLSPAPDPFITQYKGRYYAVEVAGDNTIRMRDADSLGRLLAAPANVIWTENDPSRNHDIWAPAFADLNDHWYVYWTGDDGDIFKHHMQVLESDGLVSQGARPTGPYHYKAQLNDPSSSYFGIDGVPFTHNGSLYFVWASGHCCGFDRLRIAPMANPWTLTGASYEMPVDLCDTVAEAPATIHRNGRTFLTYSVCDTGKPDYQIKMLSIADGDDPMNSGSWRNHGTVFASNPDAGVWSVGSNGFFTSPDGTEDWIVYQAKNTGASGDNTYAGRDTRAQRFTWNADGTPNFGAPVAKGADLALPSGDPGPAPKVINDTDIGGGAPTGPIRGPGDAGKCIDVSGDDTAATGAAVQLWDCQGSRDQQWTLMGDGTIRSMGKCMDVEGYGTANFSKIHLWDCHGGTNQIWQAQSNGSLKNPASGRCLDLNAGNTANGTQLQIYDCNNQWPQSWHLPAGGGTGSVRYSGNWSAGTSCGVQCYRGNDHYTDQSGAAATITFTGTKIALLGVRDVGNGIAALSIDNGPEVTVDYYGPVRDGERVLWVSPQLGAGTHVLRIRNTGTKSSASQATYIGFDRAEVY